jgi:hypothetical protein
MATATSFECNSRPMPDNCMMSWQEFFHCRQKNGTGKAHGVGLTLYGQGTWHGRDPIQHRHSKDEKARVAAPARFPGTLDSQTGAHMSENVHIRHASSELHVAVTGLPCGITCAHMHFLSCERQDLMRPGTCGNGHHRHYVLT